MKLNLLKINQTESTGKYMIYINKEQPNETAIAQFYVFPTAKNILQGVLVEFESLSPLEQTKLNEYCLAYMKKTFSDYYYSLDAHYGNVIETNFSKEFVDNF